MLTQKGIEGDCIEVIRGADIPNERDGVLSNLEPGESIQLRVEIIDDRDGDLFTRGWNRLVHQGFTVLSKELDREEDEPYSLLVTITRQ